MKPKKTPTINSGIALTSAITSTSSVGLAAQPRTDSSHPGFFATPGSISPSTIGGPANEKIKITGSHTPALDTNLSDGLVHNQRKRGRTSTQVPLRGEPKTIEARDSKAPDANLKRRCYAL